MWLVSRLLDERCRAGWSVDAELCKLNAKVRCVDHAKSLAFLRLFWFLAIHQSGMAGPSPTFMS
jgi:hypothetical protein